MATAPVSTAAPAAAAPAASSGASSASTSSAESTSTGEGGGSTSEPASTGADPGAAIVKSEGPLPGEDNIAYLQRVQLEKLKASGVDVDAQAAQIAAGEDFETPQVEPTGEQAITTAEPAKPAPVEQKTEETAAEPEVVEDPLTLQEIVLYTPRDLAAIAKDPKNKAELERMGFDTNQLFATARIANKGYKVLEAFDGDVDAALSAKDDAETFGKLGNLLIEGETPEDTRALLAELQTLDVLLDDEGKPRTDDKGNPVNGGAIGRLINNTFQLGIEYWLAKSEELGDADIKAAAEVFQKLYSEKPGSASAPDYSQLDEATRARLEQADAREKEVADREAADRTRVFQEFETSIAQGIDASVDKEIRSLLQTSSLTEAQVNSLVRQSKEQLVEKMGSKTNFFMKRDALARRPMNDKTKQERVALGVKTARAMLGGPRGIVATVAADLGYQLIGQAKAASDKTAAQAQASKSEVKAHGGTPSPTAPETPRQQNERLRQAFQKDKGRDPSTTEMFQLVAMDKRRARA